MIVTNTDSLRTKSNDFIGTEEELQSLIECLEFELKQSKSPGVGLSAIQIGIPKKVAIIRNKRLMKVRGKKQVIEDTYNLYNTKIISQSNPFIYKGEGCLSMPFEIYNTKRFNEIEIENGDNKRYKFSGFLAVVVQHELNHWYGKLISDYTV